MRIYLPFSGYSDTLIASEKSFSIRILWEKIDNTYQNLLSITPNSFEDKQFLLSLQNQRIFRLDYEHETKICTLVLTEKILFDYEEGAEVFDSSTLLNRNDIVINNKYYKLHLVGGSLSKIDTFRLGLGGDDTGLLIDHAHDNINGYTRWYVLFVILDSVRSHWEFELACSETDYIEELLEEITTGYKIKSADYDRINNFCYVFV